MSQLGLAKLLAARGDRRGSVNWLRACAEGGTFATGASSVCRETGARDPVQSETLRVTANFALGVDALHLHDDDNDDDDNDYRRPSSEALERLSLAAVFGTTLKTEQVHGRGVRAAYLLGFAFSTGFGSFDADPEEAFKWYGVAAEHGYAKALFNLGLMREAGVGCAKVDVIGAAGCYDQCFAALKRRIGCPASFADVDADEAYDYGVLLLRGDRDGGRGRGHALRDALEALDAAAVAGHLEAAFAAGLVGLMQANRSAATASREAAEQGGAARLLRAARRGHPEAARCVAMLYERGLGLPQDFDRAARWYGVCAERGHQPRRLEWLAALTAAPQTIGAFLRGRGP